MPTPISTMASSLSLEERTIGRLLVYPYQYFSMEHDACFLDMEEDKAIIQGHSGGAIIPKDHRFIDVVQRNPIVYVNVPYAAGKIVGRAVEQTNCRIGPALVSVISDPLGVGKHRRYGITHDIGDGKQASFVFFHQLGVQLRIGEQVDAEISAYVTAYEQFWTQLLGQDPFSELKRKEMAEYKKCLNPEIHHTIQPVLLEGDKLVIAVLAALGPQNLRNYAKKYTAKPL